MIDFRYHLVSIVSIFLALAVGIVLGAGPLQGQIGDTLTAEITQLRADKSALRGEVTALEQQAAERDAWDEATLDRVVSGLVTGRGVAVVVLPGVDTQEITAVSEVITAAGGTVASTTKLQNTLVSTDPAAVKARQDVADKLAPGLRVPSSATGVDKNAELIDRVIAASLVSSNSLASSQDASREALTALVDAKLIDTTPGQSNLGQLAIILSSPITDGTTKDQEAVASNWVRMATALDAAAVGSVMGRFVGPPATGKGTSVVTALRANTTAAAAVSTVDNASTSRGLASLVLALTQQEKGESGQYGDDPGVTAPFAPLPTGP